MGMADAAPDPPAPGDWAVVQGRRVPVTGWRHDGAAGRVHAEEAQGVPRMDRRLYTLPIMRPRP